MNFLNSLWNKIAPYLGSATPVPVPSQILTSGIPIAPSVEPQVVAPQSLTVGTSFTSVEDLRKVLTEHLSEDLKWRYIVLHHSETDDDAYKGDFEGIRHYHMVEKGWAEIAYHFLIEKVDDKLVIRIGRPLSMQGAHCQGFNKDAKAGIGICHVGNFDHYKPDPVLIQLSLQLSRMLMQLFDIPKENVIGHRESFVMLGKSVEKLCPGSRFDLQSLRAML